MPIGVLTNVAAVALGGLSGVILTKWINDRVALTLTMVFGLCALVNGINSVFKASVMPAVVLSVIAGTLIGELLQLDRHVKRLFEKMLAVTPLHEKELNMPLFVTVAVVFCVSGFGIYGVFAEGMSGDASFLLSKAILDFFTAIIFAKGLGLAVSLIAIPQLFLMTAFFFLGKLIGPQIGPDQMQNFVACGGALTIAAGLTIAEIKRFPLVNLLPSLVLIIPITWLYKIVF